MRYAVLPRIGQLEPRRHRKLGHISLCLSESSTEYDIWFPWIDMGVSTELGVRRQP